MDSQRINWRRLLAYTAIAVAVVTLPALAFETWRADRIAGGVTASGVDLSGLERHEAEAKLRAELEEPLLSPIKAVYDGHAERLTAAGAGIEVDVEGMADEAVRESHGGFFVLSAIRNALGIDRNTTIENRITYSRKAVDNFVARIKRANNQQAVDARVTFSAKGLGEVDGQVGVKVKERKLRRAIIAAFTDPQLPRRIKVPVSRKRPKVERDDLAEKYPAAIIVDRGGFRLRLYKNLKHAKTYRIAVGQVGLETPAGLYSITSMQTNPAWHVPNSDWAGDLAGKTIPPGDPSNPIKARWMGLYGGVGIHGTSATNSIGTAASHGCIRMLIPDVEELYERVKLGTPVYIA
jgi:lipoprotein-anchoring transpeptidase ErfK/SrfK